MERELSPETFHLYLSGAPWLRLLFPFAGGIILALAISPDSAFFFREMYALLAFLLLAYLLSLYDRNGLGPRKWIPASLAMLFLCCAGFQLTRADISLHTSAHFSKHSWNRLQVQVHTIPERRGKYLRFEARAILGDLNPAAGTAAGANTSGSAPAGSPPNPLTAGPGRAARGLLLVYLQPKKVSVPAYGDRLWITPAFREVPPPANPAAFDYRGYLAARDIYHQVFLSPDQWAGTGKNRGNPLIKWAAGVQKRCAGIIAHLFQDRENAALLSAFVLGYRTGIGTETVNAFADTGTIHILSVSGLHVAILYWLIRLLLKPLALLRGGKTLQLVLTICAILCYGSISGLSPPVCRAAWLLILYVIAQFFGKPYNAENILALTAFLLLAGNPLLLADVGFQLSFIAVAGLIFFYPPLNRLYSPGRRAPAPKTRGPATQREPAGRSGRLFRYAGRLWSGLLKTIWSMIAVSLAAQLATFPLSVYYFHQFPVYFLPANLLLIPLSSLILYGGVLLLLLSGSGMPALLLAGQLSSLLDIMKQVMQLFSKLPGSVLDGIWITPLQCGSLFMLVITGALFLRYRKAAWLLIFLCVSCYMAGSLAFENCRQVRQRRLVFFHMRTDPVIGFLAGNSAVLIMNKSPDPQQYAYSVAPFLDRSGIEHVQTGRLGRPLRKAYLASGGSYFKFFNLRLLLVDDKFSYPLVSGEVLPCDLLLITENTYLQTDKIEQNFRVKMLVSGANISHALDNYLEKYCRRKNIRFYSVRRSGAFILSLASQYEF